MFDTPVPDIATVRRSAGLCKPAATFSAPECGFVLHDGDLRAIVLTFAATALLVFAGALACDLYLGAVILRGARSLQDIPSYRLALDLLPWFSMFTALIVGVGISGALAMHRLTPEVAGRNLRHRVF